MAFFTDWEIYTFKQISFETYDTFKKIKSGEIHLEDFLFPDEEINNEEVVDY